MKLYEINNSLRQILENGFVCDEETGEILLDESNLESLEIEREQKLLGIAKVLKEKKAFETMLKAEIKTLQEREKVISNEIERLENYALRNMSEGEKLSDAQATISYYKGVESVNIIDFEKIPKEYIRVKTIEEADKKKLKELLEFGNQPFAELVRNQSVRIK